MKLISKIASLSVGLALAVGVGVALGSKEARVAKADEETIDLTAQGFSNQQVVSTVTSGDFTLTFAKGSGSNDPKYYTSGSSVRTYANNTLTVSTSGSDDIVEIVFTLGGTTTAVPTASVGTYDSSSKTWEGESKTIVFTNASSGQYHYKGVKITTGSGDVLESIVVSGSMSKTSYTTAEDWSPAGLEAIGHYESGTSKNISSSVNWTFSPASPAEGVTSVIATATKGSISGSSSAQSVTVTVVHSGTQDDPFTVSDAIGHINDSDLTSSKTYYVEGLFVSVRRAWSDSYKNVSYNVTDPDDSSKSFVFYNMGHTSDPACESGDLILVSCVGNKFIKYSSDYECSPCTFVSKSKLTIPVTGITLSSSTANVRVGETLTVTPSFEPSSTTEKTINWASSDTSIATVSSEGVVTGVAIGDVTITATSTVRTSVVGSINLHVVPNSIEGDYVLTYNTSAEQPYNTALTAANFIDTTYINGVTSIYFEAPSSIDNLYVNNSPLTSYFSFAGHGSTTARLAFGLKDTLLNYVITRVILKDAKQVNISGNTDIATLSETKSGISYSMTHEEKDYAFYPFSETFDLNIDGNRIFASTIIITVERTGSGQMPSVISHFEDAILRLTQEGCTAKSVSSDEWSRVKSAHTALVAKFSNADSFIDDWTLEGNEGLRRYKNIIEKYGYEDFLDRGYVQLTALSFDFVSKGNPTIFIVVAIATASTLAFTLLLVFKKRKHN